MPEFLGKEWSGDILTTTYLDRVENKVITHRQQDVAPILQDIQDLKESGGGISKEHRHVGRIPAVVIEEYCRAKGMSFAEFMRDGWRKLLTDPDYSKLRIWEGAI